MMNQWLSSKAIVSVVIVALLTAILMVPLDIDAQTNCSQTVTSQNDSGPGTLRSAMLLGGVICFNIGGSGVQTINVLSPLPQINIPSTIDGTTQPGYAGTPLIEINGSGAGPNTSGIVVNAGSTVVKGLAINRFSNDGIILNNNGGNTIIANFVGTDPSGTIDRGNGTSGIGVATPNNVVGGTTDAERNLVSGNDGSGVAITGTGASNNIVVGNYIGTNIFGNTKLPNSADGILITFGVNNQIGSIAGVMPGGGCSGGCNLVSGNGANGIGVQGASGKPTNGNIIKSNYVGVDVTGTQALGNSDIGFEVQSGRDNTIGGISPEERNIFSGNLGAGVSITGSLAIGNTVSGNYIGVDRSGNAAIMNHKMGVNIGSPDGSSNNAHDNTIGGYGITLGGGCTGGCNVISGNAWSGIYISGSTGGNNQISGNFIGTGTNGTTILGNGQDGIGILNSPSNKIGGPNARNIISANGGNGIAIVGSNANSTRIESNYIGISTDRQLAGNAVTGIAVADGVDTMVYANSVYGNGFMGIDLNLGGVTTNDSGDQDGGPNRQQNYPVLAYAISRGGYPLIAGTLNSNANSSYEIDFFSSPTCSQTGYGQGYDYLGTTSANTNGNGDASFSFSSTYASSGGYAITATATKTYLGTRFETSEFSKCIYYPRQHPDGTLIRPLGSQNLFIVESSKNGQLGSIDVLKSHYISLSEFKIATTADTGASAGEGLYFREGTLLRGTAPDVFVIDKLPGGGYQKRKILSLQTFNNLGYSSSDVMTVSDSALNIPRGSDVINGSVHPDGTIVADGQTIYVLSNGTKCLVGSPGVYLSNRLNVVEPKQTTAADRVLPDGPNMSYREGTLVKGTSSAVYVVDDDAGVIRKRQIGSIDGFIELGYTNADIITIPNQELPASNGPPV